MRTDSPYYVKIMPDYGEYFWYRLPFHLLYESLSPEWLIKADGLLLPADLRKQLQAWYLVFGAAPVSHPGFCADIDWEAFHARGIALARKLKAFLDDVAPVYYEKPMEDPNVHEDERVEVMADGTLRPFPVCGWFEQWMERHPWLPKRVLADGQPGVARAALDWAIDLRLPHRGWCAKGRQVEDGQLSWRYQLREVPSADADAAAQRNVQDSDATLLLFSGGMDAACLTAQRLCQEAGKPFLPISLDAHSVAEVGQQIIDWLTAVPSPVLHIAGTRGPTRGRQYVAALDALNHTVGKPTQQQQSAEEAERWAQWRAMFTRR